MTINDVFQNSKIVVICDKDLMSIDISTILDTTGKYSPKAIRLRESILSALLVCDWNVRAWTLLEALRGRRNIHLLCRSGDFNALLHLRETLETVSELGSINIAILLLTQYHLFPSPNPTSWMIHNTASGATNHRLTDMQGRKIFRTSFEATHVANRTANGFVSAAEAATMLGHRFASRPGDDVVIWSLLVDKDPCHTAADFWKRELSSREVEPAIYTGFLVSSLPRLGAENCGGPKWAPAQPTLDLEAKVDEESSLGAVYPAYDGNLSRVGVLARHENRIAIWPCLKAQWGVAVVKNCASLPRRKSVKTLLNVTLRGYSHKGLREPTQKEECEESPKSNLEGVAVVKDCASQSEKDPCIDFAELNLEKGTAHFEVVERFLKQYRFGVLLQALKEAEYTAGAKRRSPKPLANIYRMPSGGLLFAVCGTNGPCEGALTWLGVYEWRAEELLPQFVVRNVLLE